MCAKRRFQECYTSLIEDLNISDVKCIRCSVSKGLGIGIVAGGSVMKIPQLLLSELTRRFFIEETQTGTTISHLAAHAKTIFSYVVREQKQNIHDVVQIFVERRCPKGCSNDS